MSENKEKFKSEDSSKSENTSQNTKITTEEKATESEVGTDSLNTQFEELNEKTTIKKKRTYWNMDHLLLHNKFWI